MPKVTRITPFANGTERKIRVAAYLERKEEAKEASSVFEEIKIGLQEAIDGDIYRETTLSTDESEEDNG